MERRNKRIALLKQRGYSWKQIGEMVGLSREWVKEIGHRFGLIGIPAKKLEKLEKIIPEGQESLF